MLPKGLQQTTKAIAAHASQFSQPVQQAVAEALENGGEQIATYEGAGEVILASISFFTAPEFAVLLGFGMITAGAVAIVIECNAAQRLDVRAAHLEIVKSDYDN